MYFRGWISIVIISVFHNYAVTYANPIWGIFDPACFVVAEQNCPNENISFWLYSNETRDAPIKLNPLELNPWDFQPVRPLKILLHGYTGYRDFAPNSHIRPVLLDNENVYVISIDYGPLVREPCYVYAVQNLRLVSKCLAQLINNLLDQGIVQNDHLHIIGFSLGAQLAGQTAKYLKRKPKHITGLDPAKPLFITASAERRLTPDDADFVDVIHTDVLGRGMLRTMGHIDFFPNIGPVQPGCSEEYPDDPGSCNHERAPRFYAESITTKVGFWANKCSGWLYYIFNMCPSNEDQALMGYHIDTAKRGSYFLKTAAKIPFALGSEQQINTTYSTLLKSNKYDLNELDRDFEPQLARSFMEYNEIIEEEHLQLEPWKTDQKDLD